MSERPVVLVTGAAKRLGREIALDLASHGFDVAVHYRHSRDEAEATVAQAQAVGAQAASFAADLADEVACRALVPAVLARFKRLDAVVIISMAQHASPNDIGHSDDLRAQFSAWSSCVVMMPSVECPPVPTSREDCPAGNGDGKFSCCIISSA